MKILVVDDSVVMRSMIVKYLAEIGLDDVDQAADGEQALALVLKTPYSIILLDQNMPKKSGMDVLKVIRARGNTVPIIMVTTDTEKMHVVEAIRAGVTDYVFKPFVKETLISRVQKALAKQR